MRINILLIVLLGTLLSCGARVKSNFDNRREALTSNEKVAFLLKQQDMEILVFQ